MAGVTVVGMLLALAWFFWRPGLGVRGTSTSVDAARASSVPVVSVVPPQETVFAGYAGTPTCLECHEKAAQGWAGSNHALAERAPEDALDAPAFEPARSFPHGSQSTEVRRGPAGFEIATLALGDSRSALPVVRVIGHNPLRQFLVEAPGGRLQATEAAWDPHKGEWFNVYGSEDRQPGEWGHWTGRGMNWNSMCATCHNTRYRKNYDPVADVFSAGMAERSVGCEACHGPSKEHVNWQRAWGQSPGKKDPTVAALRRSPQSHMETCAPCHARRSEITGDVVHDGAFWDHFLLATVDGTDLFYPDGQVRDEDYEYSAFLGSRMHAAGVTCLDCHDPHSGKTRISGNDLCLQCHQGQRPGAPVIDASRHSFHKAGGTGDQCIACHMPVTTYMQRHPRHDHGFTSPDPLLTVEFGIPNACNRCHTDKDAAWAVQAAEGWYGPRLERPSRARTRTLAKGRRGDPAVIPSLVDMVNRPEAPYWKAAAVALLEDLVGRPEVASAVSGQLTNDHPLVRWRAVQALEPLVVAGQAAVADRVRERLDDPMRAVRVAAAWTLRQSLDLQSRPGRELMHMLALNADQPAGQAQWGALELSRGHPELAVPHYQRAVAWDAGSPAFRHDLAVALSLAGRVREALEATREAVRLEPTSAEAHYRLALASNEAGDRLGTLESLREAVRLDSGHGRAWYNLGLALNGAGDTEGALNALLRGESVMPGDVRIPYARATVLAGAGRLGEARAAVARALEIDPRFEPARELAGRLGGVQ